MNVDETNFLTLYCSVPTTCIDKAHGTKKKVAHHVLVLFASIVHRPFLPVEQFRCVFCMRSQHEEQSTHIMRF